MSVSSCITFFRDVPYHADLIDEILEMQLDLPDGVHTK